MLRRHLELAEGHVARGRTNLVRQRQIVAELERDHHDNLAEGARKVLAAFEDIQNMHLRICNLIVAEIADSERQRVARSMRSMSRFNRSQRCWVHEQLNDNVFAWDPNREWVRWACHHASGAITWDGLLFDGWWPWDERPTHVEQEWRWSS